VRAQLERRRVMLRLHESEKLAAIGTMSAGLAHEMRNPANALVNAVQPLLEILPPEVTAPGTAVAELLEVIKDASAQIGRLSKQLLGFRRDGAEIATEVVSASSIIERSLAITGPVLKAVDLKLELRYAGEVACASALIMQVLCNLLDNAAHAAGKGGSVSVTTYVEGARFVCEIGDSGKSVPPLLRERIFEPFFTTKAPGEGTGLGLSTARQIAERHHGALYVRPTEQSSVFRLELPLTPVVAQSPRMTA
jgi:signal transduction histidine kinase